MKRAILVVLFVAGLGTGSPILHSQAPAPAPAAPTGTPLEQLKAIRDQNAKLLEQQAATLQKLDDLEKESQAIKVMGRRS